MTDCATKVAPQPAPTAAQALLEKPLVVTDSVDGLKRG